MELKKIIFSGLKFLLLVLVLYLSSLFVLSKVKSKGKPIIFKTADIYKVKGGNSYQKFKEFNLSTSYDIIVIGSSHAYRGYDPRNFKRLGLNMFNLGSSSQSPLNTFYIVNNYITPKSCKLVIFDLYDGAFNNNGFESSSDLIQNISSTKAALQMATCYTNPQIANMLGLRFFNQNSPPSYFDSSYIGNGYNEKFDTLKYSLPFQDYENQYLPSTLQIEYLDKILQYFKDKNIPIITTTTPVPKEKSRYEHDRYSKIFLDLSNKYNIKYLDYSFNSNFNSEQHFYDSHHLNQLGVDLYNKILIDDLRKLNYIK